MLLMLLSCKYILVVLNAITIIAVTITSINVTDAASAAMIVFIPDSHPSVKFPSFKFTCDGVDYIHSEQYLHAKKAESNRF